MSNSKKYTKLTDREHVLLRPARYIGAITEHTEETYVPIDGKMVKKEVTYNPALLKMFDEIVSNSADEAKRKGSRLDKIFIEVNQLTGEFSVHDNGGIPVEMHDEHNQWIPDMIFSELRSGSNFDDSVDSIGTGQNGEGSSLVSIFSTMFNVDTSDGKNNFTIRYENNLSVKHEPIITPCNMNYTCITWIPDYKRLTTSLTADNMLMIEKRVLELAACNPNVKVSYNGTPINIKFSGYVRRHSKEALQDKQKDWNVYVAPSDGSFDHVSFVNGTATKIGGTHVQFVCDQIVKAIREFIKKKHKVDVKPNDIKNQLFLFIDATIVNPRYDSQTKDKLVTEPKDYKTNMYSVSNKFITEIAKSSIIQSVLDWVEAKKKREEMIELRREQKKQKSKTVDTYIHANHKMRSKCILYLVEGQSALSHFLSVCDRQIHGAFPLKGKPMNTRESKPVDIIKNEEISSILSILGLKFGEEATNLNYGKIRIMTDADTDGASIQGLLLNLFYYWPELFTKKMIEIVLAPIIIARKGGDVVKRYYNMDDFNADKANGVLDGCETKYYKGLGSMDEDEYSLLINEPVKIIVDIDEETNSMLNVVYGNNVKLRKEWLL